MNADEILKKNTPASTPKWLLFLHGLVVDLACAFILVFLLMFLIVGGFTIGGAFIGVGREVGSEIIHFFGDLITPVSVSIVAAITIVRYCYSWRKASIAAKT